MSIPNGTEFPLSNFQRAIITTFEDAKLIISVNIKNLPQNNRTQLIVFVVFYRTEHAENAAKIGKFTFEGQQLTVSAYKRPRKDRQLVSNLLEQNLVKCVRVIDATHIMVACNTNDFQKEQRAVSQYATEGFREFYNSLLNLKMSFYFGQKSVQLILI